MVGNFLQNLLYIKYGSELIFFFIDVGFYFILSVFITHNLCEELISTGRERAEKNQLSDQNDWLELSKAVPALWLYLKSIFLQLKQNVFSKSHLNWYFKNFSISSLHFMLRFSCSMLFGPLYIYHL